MRLRNFKGIEEFTLNTNGESVEVFGDNAAGKTTLQDAFTWVLFGKNARMEKQFAVKTLDAEGNEIRDLEHEVELTLDVDGRQVTLRKMLYEHKSKKATDGTFEDKVKLFVDDVPMKTQKAYDAKVQEIMDEETFKMITSPNYFSEVLAWSVQREKLFEMCGDITDAEVIAANVELADLPELLNGKTFDERKAQVDHRRKELQTRIDAIPPRIAEAKLQIPKDVTNADADRAESERLLNEINALQVQKANIQSGAAITTKQADIRVLEAEMTSCTQQFNANAGQATTQLQVALQEKQGNLSIAQAKLKQFESELQSKDYAINQTVKLLDETKNARQNMLNQYNAIKGLIYEESPVEDACPTCKQSLPTDQVEMARKAAAEAWKLEQSTKLAQIVKNGEHFKPQIAELEHKLSTLQQERQQLVEQYQQAQTALEPHHKALEKVQQQLQQAQNSTPDITQDAQYNGLLARKQSLMSELQQLQAHASESIVDIDQSINELQLQKRDIDLRLAQVVNVDSAKKRIAELEAEQRGYADELERLEYTKHLIKAFEETKVRMLEAHINSKFKHATFKLFHTQKNGDVTPTCEVMYEGVPYRALNTAMKVNIGLDIIATLQQHYGVKSVIFVDNRESITKLNDIGTQTVSLIVSEQDKQLRVVAGVKSDYEQQSLFGEVV